MKIIYVKDNIVHQVLPGSTRPLEAYYDPAFVAGCREADDIVQCGWIYDPGTDSYSPPEPPVPEPPPPDLSLRMGEMEEAFEALIAGLAGGGA